MQISHAVRRNLHKPSDAASATSAVGALKKQQVPAVAAVSRHERFHSEGTIPAIANVDDRRKPVHAPPPLNYCQFAQ